MRDKDNHVDDEDEDDKDNKDTGRGGGTRTWTMSDGGQGRWMSTRATRMKMKTTRMRRTMMRTRGEDNKEDEVERQQGGHGTTTRMFDKDLDNEAQMDEYKDCKLYNHCCLMYFHSITVWLAEDLFLLVNP